ncbi:hypothetical protein BD410DRAFT_898713 [Rickenella mellea]|uniref:Uncharacterized protein n=1 Tax=Rickenella mellea TaxID=50990 RepID=A0A4Y7Q2N6_9AGAM|nr:hypothetical protein BD410DRAFT_898713 [Rickenella mellea]
MSPPPAHHVIQPQERGQPSTIRFLVAAFMQFACWVSLAFEVGGPDGETPTSWSIVATIFSFVFSMGGTYPLRQNNDDKIVTICFNHYILSHVAAVAKWLVPHINTDYIPTFILGIVAFYIAELAFHRFLSTFNPHLGDFERVHMTIWIVWWAFTDHERFEKARRTLERSRQAGGTVEGAPVVATAPASEQACSSPPPCSTAGNTNDLAPTSV